jgi:hypothetical protein
MGILDLPESVLTERLLVFLQACDLISASLVCKQWSAASDSDQVWKNLCRRKWRGKANMSFSYDGASTAPFGKIRLTTQSVDSLTIKKLRQLLGSRGISFSKFIEKDEFKKAFLDSSPQTGHQFQNMWKASYAYALQDAKRQELTIDELCGASWVFFFKHSAFKSNFKFLRSGKVESGFSGGLNDHSQWRLVHFRKTMIQIDQYPPLTMSRRTNDWGWRLENERVVFYSEHYGCDVRTIYSQEYPPEDAPV